MSIIIKGMEMPKDGDVLMVRKDDGKTYIKESHTWGYSAELIELPAPHGRLIDADALIRDNGIKEIPEYYEVVCAAPTIIEADKEET